MPPSLIGEFSILNNFFEYVDQDLKRSVKRYSSELVEQHQWRHDLSDLTLFMELIKHVLGNIERYIAPADGAEHGGKGQGNREHRRAKGKGRGKERRAKIGPYWLYNYLYKSKLVFSKKPYKYRRLTGFYSFGK